jgi:hypothetical protein
MAGPVYKLSIADFLEAWYQLSQEEQDNFLAKMSKALEEVGGKRLILCDSRWSSEQWVGFGIEEFPDIEAEQKYAKALEDLNWFRYFKSMTLLGTESEWAPILQEYATLGD